MSEEHGLWNKTKKATNNIWHDTKQATENVWSETKNAANKVKQSLKDDFKHHHQKKNPSEFIYEECDMYEEIDDEIKSPQHTNREKH